MHIISSSRRSSSWALVVPFAGLLALDQPSTPQPARPASAPGQAERIAVPLSDPAKPARLEVALLGGSITVRGHEGREVSVEVRTRPDEDEKPCRGCDRSGLTRLANTASGLVIEEQDNRVKIKSQLSNREIDIVVTVPTRTSLKLSVVNDGDIVVTGVDGELEVQNTNGAVMTCCRHYARINDDLKVCERIGKPIVQFAQWRHRRRCRARVNVRWVRDGRHQATSP
jgi:hypothetical protein